MSRLVVALVLGTLVGLAHQTVHAASPDNGGDGSPFDAKIKGRATLAKRTADTLPEGVLSRPSGQGTIDAASVAKVFARRRAALARCLDGLADPHRQLTVRFSIGPAGRVTTIAAVETTTSVEEVGACVVGQLRNWHFSEVVGGQVTFSYALDLASR